MKNRTVVNFDGICLYIDSYIGAALIGKIILIMANLIGWSLFFYVAVNISGEEVKPFLFPLVFFFLVLFMVARFTAWNLWGAEFIRINSKSLSYSRSYGVIQTKEKVIEFKALRTSYEKIRYFNDVEHGNLYFYDYDELDNPFEIFRTSVLISKPKADEILQNIDTAVGLGIFYEKVNSLLN